MKLTEIAKTGLQTLWTHKYLWFFGFFVAAGSGGGGSGRSGPEGGAAAGAGATFANLPPWAFALMAAGLVLGLIFLVLQVLSEAALIEGVAEGQQGQRRTIREGLRRGRQHFWTLLGLKLLLGLVTLVSMAVMFAPLGLALLKLLPLWLGITLTVPLALAGIAWLLTLYFVYEYALRFAVLEGRRALDALGQARRFLHGRLMTAIKLTLLAFVGQLGGNLAAVVVMIPAALVGGLVYLFAGLVPALVTGSVLAAPLVVTVMGATGAFRSSVWTLGFIGDRHAPVGPAAEALAGEGSAA